MLFNEPKLLKYIQTVGRTAPRSKCFSALQRAEIAEISQDAPALGVRDPSFSALQRAEIAEMFFNANVTADTDSFSALQRAEIAEMPTRC